MKLLKGAFLLLLSALSVFTLAQQLPLLSNYYINPYLSNPALAGSKGSNLFLMHRNPFSGGQGNPETFLGTVDADGVAIDTDHDRVPDVLDQEIETPHWKHTGEQPSTDASKCIVDANGITKDSDADGVPDCVDQELLSPKGAKVNRKGVSLKTQEEVIAEKSTDSDDDGIADELDLEPNTPIGSSVDQWGRSPQANNDMAAVHRIEVEEIEDNSKEWNYYVIVGVFRYYNNLKNYQKYLLKTYDESTQVLVTDQSYYYVWTRQVTTKTDASAEVTRLSAARLKDYIVGNPWLWREPKKK